MMATRTVVNELLLDDTISEASRFMTEARHNARYEEGLFAMASYVSPAGEERAKVFFTGQIKDAD